MDIERILRNKWTEKVLVGGPGECWLWLASTGSHGYGQVWDGEHNLLAHRVAWTMIHGVIPEGMTIDHICRVRRCVNVDHLRLLTNVENATDNGNKRKTECMRGHLFTLENTTVTKKGHRKCRECRKLTRKD